MQTWNHLAINHAWDGLLAPGPPATSPFVVCGTSADNRLNDFNSEWWRDVLTFGRGALLLLAAAVMVQKPRKRVAKRGMQHNKRMNECILFFS